MCTEVFLFAARAERPPGQQGLGEGGREGVKVSKKNAELHSRPVSPPVWRWRETRGADARRLPWSKHFTGRCQMGPSVLKALSSSLRRRQSSYLFTQDPKCSLHETPVARPYVCQHSRSAPNALRRRTRPAAPARGPRMPPCFQR